MVYGTIRRASALFLLLLVCFFPTLSHAAPSAREIAPSGISHVLLTQAPPSAFAPAQQGGDAPKPFAAPPSAFGGEAGRTAPNATPDGFFTRIQVWILETQRELHRDLAKAVRDMRADPFHAGLTLVLLSFVYGILHAAGPGHGKAIISSYVVANRQTARRAVAISFASAAVQGLAAVALVIVLRLILDVAGVQMQAIVAQLETASFALICLVGVWLFAGQLRRIAGKYAQRWHVAREPRTVSLSAAAVHDHDHHGHHFHSHGHHHDGHSHDHHHHDENCGCGHAHVPSAQELQGDLSLRRAAAIVFAVGIRPCTGAILVLVFALTQGLFWAGVLATFAMAIGTAITVSALTVAAVGAREMTARLAAGGGGRLWADVFYDMLALAGTFVIFALGLVLLMGSLGPAKPF